MHNIIFGTFDLPKILGVKVRITNIMLVISAIFFMLSGLAAAAYMALAYIMVLFHEFGHVLVARRYNVDCDTIVLLPIGGMAMLNAPIQSGAKEFVVAVAGPAVNIIFAIASGLAGVFFFPDSAFLKVFFFINFVLGVFNLLPAFPMDGGRALRAVLYMLGMSQLTSTKYAVYTSWVMFAMMGTYALWLGEIILALIVFVMFFAGLTELRRVKSENQT